MINTGSQEATKSSATLRVWSILRTYSRDGSLTRAFFCWFHVNRIHWWNLHSTCVVGP